MGCLNDIQIQQLADGEAGPESRSHAQECVRCAARLDERRRLMATLTATAAAADLPSPAFAARVGESVRAQAPAPARGATVLRPVRRPARKPLWASALAAAAAAAVIMFLVLPRVDAPATLSASQVIDRSVQQLTGGSGVELLDYELLVSSDYRQRVGLPQGPYRIVQVFDRGNPARFKFSQFDGGGVLVAATAQDPARGRRTELRRVDDRNYIVTLTALPGPMLSIPELLQTQAESILRLMQLDADEHLTTVIDGDATHYVIELPDPPAIAATPAGAPLRLDHARVEIDGRDFRVREFAARGTLLGLPFDVSIRLISQIKAAQVAPAEWEIQPGAGDVVLEGDGRGDVTDSMDLVLRELGRLHGR